MNRLMRKPAFAFVKTYAQISCVVTAQLISAFVFATHKYCNQNYFPNNIHLLWVSAEDEFCRASAQIIIKIAITRLTIGAMKK